MSLYVRHNLWFKIYCSSGLKKLYSQTFWRYILMRSCKTTWYPLLIIFSFYNCNVMFNMFLLINSHTKIHIKLYDIIILRFWPLPWSLLLFRIVHLILLFLISISYNLSVLMALTLLVLVLHFIWIHLATASKFSNFDFLYNCDQYMHASFCVTYLFQETFQVTCVYNNRYVLVHVLAGQKNFMLKYKSIEQGPHDLETLYQKKKKLWWSGMEITCNHVQVLT